MLVVKGTGKLVAMDSSSACFSESLSCTAILGWWQLLVRNLNQTFATALLLLPFSVVAAGLSAGTAHVDITPSEPVHLGGYAARTGPHKSIKDRIFVKALALKDETGTATLLLTADTIGTPAWFRERLADRLQKELDIPSDRFLLACSHSHSTPAVKSALENAYNLGPDAKKSVEAYSLLFLERTLTAAKAAFNNLEPVKLAFGRGEAHFAVNRRQFNTGGVSIGVNPDGNVDRGVPVLSVQRNDESLKAIVFGYACHCTTLGATYEVSGDWAGYAQRELEEAYPEATALFITGCGADANPSPRGKSIHVAQHGLELAGAVARVLNEPMMPIRGSIQSARAMADLPLASRPSKTDLTAMLTNATPAVVRHAQHFLGMLERGEPLPSQYPCPVQVIRFGQDLMLVALGGEVVSDYAFRLRREFPQERVWAAGYCNDVFAYLPSVRILTEGGYEADASMIYYRLPTRFAPQVEEVVIKTVQSLAAQTKVP